VTLLAYIPFVHPIGWFHIYWYLLLIPLALGISIIYKALRMHDLRLFWRHVLVMTTQIVLGMVALAVALIVFVQWVLPMLPVDRTPH
jgi:hypothetical protein